MNTLPAPGMVCKEHPNIEIMSKLERASQAYWLQFYLSTNSFFPLRYQSRRGVYGAEGRQGLRAECSIISPKQNTRAGFEKNHVTNSSAFPANPTLQDSPWIWRAKSLDSMQTVEDCFPEKNQPCWGTSRVLCPVLGSSGQKGHGDARAGTAEGKSSQED